MIRQLHYLGLLLPLFTTSSWAAEQNSSVHIAPAGSHTAVYGSAENFIGRVRVDPLFNADNDIRVSAAYVTFEPSARSAWHTHPAGQRLIVTSGVGLTQQEVIRRFIMKILVAGATGSIGIHVVNTAIAMGHQPVALVRNRRKIKLLPRGTDIFYGDVSIPETLTDLPKDIDAIIFTLGSDGQGRIGARAIDYGGVRNILRIFMDTPVRIALMTTIGVTERLSSWNQRTEVHDWKRRSERLVRACGHIYTIVRPGWFDYNNDDEHRIVMLQGDRRHAGTPEDGVISREQIAQVLVTALSNDAAKNKTFELVAERGEAQQDLTLLFAELRNDNPQKNDGVFDIDNMPLTEEPECVINDLNLYSKNSKI